MTVVDLSGVDLGEQLIQRARGLELVGRRFDLTTPLRTRFRINHSHQCRLSVRTPHPLHKPSDTSGLARFVRCRDMTCRFPGCDEPADRCDVDHTIPYPV